MKKLAFLFTCLIPFAAAAQIKVIENPDYRIKNTGLETISKIELHDTVTKVHMHISFLPGWWIEYYPTDFIKPVNSDDRLFLIGIENEELNKQLSTPSGEADYVLLFPPLDKSVKEIHYGDIKNGQEVIAIHNISLENSCDPARYEKSREIPASIQKRLEEEVKKTEGKETADFDSDNFFSTEPARLVGFIRGYSSDTIKAFTMYPRDLSGMISPLSMKLYSDGFFEADIHIEHPKMLSFSLLKAGEASFYIEPGHVLAMILDWEDVLKGDRYRDRRHLFTHTEFAGSLAEVNRDLLKRAVFKPSWFEIEHRKNSMSPTEHRIDIENRINNNLESLREIEAAHPLHPKARRLIENEIKADALSELLDFDMNYLRREQEKGGPPLSTDYYGPLRVLPDDRSLLAVLSSDRLLSSLNNASIFFRPGNVYRPEFKPDESFGDYLAAEGKVVSEELTKFLPLIQETLEASDGRVSEEAKKTLRENNEIIQQALQEHINEFMAYQSKYTEQDPIGNYTINLQKRSKLLTDSLGIHGILKDVALVHNHLMLQDAFKDLPSDDVNFMTERLIDQLTNPYMKRRVSD